MGTRSWLSIIGEADPEWRQTGRDAPAYRFSNDRTFKDSRASIAYAFPDVALTDRATGNPWVLQNNAAGKVKIVNPLPVGFSGTTHAAYDGPIVDTRHGPARLLVRNERLGYELIAAGAADGPVYAPNVVQADFADTIYRIQAPAAFVVGGVLSYETDPL